MLLRLSRRSTCTFTSICVSVESESLLCIQVVKILYAIVYDQPDSVFLRQQLLLSSSSVTSIQPPPSLPSEGCDVVSDSTLPLLAVRYDLCNHTEHSQFFAISPYSSTSFITSSSPSWIFLTALIRLMLVHLLPVCPSKRPQVLFY